MSALPSTPPVRGVTAAGSPGPPRRPKRGPGTKTHLLGLTTAVTTAGFCAASGWTLYDLRQTTYAQAVSGESNLLSALSQDIARNVEVYDLSLQGVVDGLSEPKLSGIDPHLQDPVLFDRAASAKDLGAILVLDRDGTVVRGSKPEAIGANLGDGESTSWRRRPPRAAGCSSAPRSGAGPRATIRWSP